MNPIAKFDDALVALLQQDIFTGLGLDDLPDAERQAMLDTMLATIKDRVLARVLDELSADERAELTRLVDSDQTDAVSEFLAEHVTDLDALMTQEALQYKVEMVANAQQIRRLLGDADDQATTGPYDTTADANLPVVAADDLPVPYTPPALPATTDEAPPMLPPLPNNAF